jgi:predicted nucleotidyltransferase
VITFTIVKAAEKNILNRIKAAILRVDPNAEIMLFGSRARGENRPNSDWDILVLTELDLTSKTDEIPFWNAVLPIEIDQLQDISLAIRSKDQWKKIHSNAPLYDAIASEGITI